MTGYLAFPPVSIRPPTSIRSTDPDEEHGAPSLIEQAWEDQRRRDADAHAQKLRSEHEQALLGEIEWVRTGGWLRDAYGRKDRARTAQLREEIRIRDEERRALEQWRTYEAHWRLLLVSDTPITFQDVPWPVFPPPASVDDLTDDAIRQFVVAPLRVRTNTVTPKNRLRHLLLRWHPDKLSVLVSRTIARDLGVVLAGINAVFYVLKGLQDSERCLDVHVQG